MNNATKIHVEQFMSLVLFFRLHAEVTKFENIIIL